MANAIVPVPSFRPYSNVQPFTVRDGATYLLQLEAIKDWLRDYLVPFIDSETSGMEEAWREQVTLLVTQVNDAVTSVEQMLATGTAEVTDLKNAAEAAHIAAEAARDLAAQYASDAEEIQDTAIASIAGNETSDTRAFLDATYAKAAEVASIAELIATGRLSEDALSTAFDEKADAATNGKRAIGQDELVINVQDFGAKGDADENGVGTNDSPAIVDAIAAAVSLGRRLWFPRVANGYRTEVPVVIPGSVDVQMDSPVFSAHNGIGIDYNPAPNGIAYRRNLVFDQIRATQSDWLNATNIGVVTRNVVESEITIVRVKGNTTGYRRVGENAGHVHNQIALFLILNNKFGVETDSVGTGWVNEELLTGGRFAVDTGVNRSTSRYGIVVRSTSEYLNNALTHLKPSMELNFANTLGGAEALPILVSHGAYNEFLGVRDEGNSQTLIRTEGKSQENLVTVSYGSQTGSLVSDVGDFPSTIVSRGVQTVREKAVSRVFDTGALQKLAVAYDASQTMIPGLAIIASSGGTLFRQQTGVIPSAAGVSFSVARAGGKVVDTGKCKRFVVRRNAFGNGGRVVIKPLDANGNVIDGSVVKIVKSVASTPLGWTTSYGGAYLTGGDNTTPIYFTVADNVKQVYVGVGGGTASAEIISITLDALDPIPAPVIEQFPEALTPLATQAPAYGTWNRGQVIKNGAPSAGQPRGWVCTVSGTPGTWVSEGNL